MPIPGKTRNMIAIASSVERSKLLEMGLLPSQFLIIVREKPKFMKIKLKDTKKFTTTFRIGGLITIAIGAAISRISTIVNHFFRINLAIFRTFH